MRRRGTTEVSVELAQIHYIADDRSVILNDAFAVKGGANQGAEAVLGIHPSTGDVAVVITVWRCRESEVSELGRPWGLEPVSHLLAALFGHLLGLLLLF